MLGNQVPAPSERLCRRLVSCEEKGHRLVPHLEFGHPTAIPFLVASLEQHREEVTFVLPALLSLLYDAVDYRVQRLLRALDLMIACELKPPQYPGTGGLEPVEA